ncbi:hypothetical protein [Novipirellula caenicola]|uniref:Transmembrane protein n=1 Tax=Novipirellula caenicola TaxID=1536901 RepID=A0ABP9W0E5_9BACT
MLTTKVRRVAGRDLLLVGISSFVLAMEVMPVGGQAESADNTTAPVVVQSIPAVIVPVSADAAVARWQAEVAQFYASQSQASGRQQADELHQVGDPNELGKIARTSFVTPTTEQPSSSSAVALPHQQDASALPSGSRLPNSASQAEGVAFQGQSIVFACVFTAVVSIVFAAWCVAFPKRQISPAMWGSRFGAAGGGGASQSCVVQLDPSWFRVSQPLLVRARQCCFAMLVGAAMWVCVS